MSIETLIEHGLYIAGATEPLAGDTREIVNPGTGELVGRVTSATAEDADRAVRAAHDGTARVGEARVRRAREGHPRVRGGVRGARRRAGADPRRRAGQDDPRGQDRAAQGGRHARALRRPVAPGARDQRPQPRPRRRRPRAAPPARRRGRDRAVELPDHAAVQQARPGVAGRQHGRGQAGRHDAADHAPAGRDLRRGRAAGGRLQRALRPRQRRRRRARPPPARAQGRLHRLARRSASRSRRSPRPGPSA